MTVPQTTQIILDIAGRFSGLQPHNIDAAGVANFVHATQQDLFSALTPQLTISDTNQQEFQRTHTIIVNLINQLRRTQQDAQDDLIDTYAPGLTLAVAITNARSEILRIRGLMAGVTNPNIARSHRQNITDITNRIQEADGLLPVITELERLVRIGTVGTPPTGFYHRVFELSNSFNTVSTLPAQRVDLGVPAPHTIPNVLQQFHRTGTPTPTTMTVNTIDLDIGNNQQVSLSGIAAVGSDIVCTNIQVTNPANFDTYPLVVQVPVTAEYRVIHNGVTMPIRHTKNIALTINRPLLSFADQEIQVRTLQPQYNLATNAVWNSTDGYTQILRREVDTLLTNNGISGTLLSAERRNALIDAILEDPAFVGVYDIGRLQNDIVNAGVVGRPGVPLSGLFITDDTQRRLSTSAFLTHLRTQLSTDQAPIVIRDFLGARIRQIISQPALQTNVMTAATDAMNDYQNSVQQLTTATAQPLLQHNLNHFETNRGNLWPVHTIAERYRGNPIVRRFRNVRDWFNGRSPDRSRLRTVINRNNPEQHNYMSFFTGTDTTANPVTKSGIQLPRGGGEVTIATSISMQSYQQISPRITVSGAVDYTFDERFTHAGSLQGIIEGIMRDETVIPGTDAASAYVIKSQVILSLYKSFVAQAIQRMGALQDYQNPRTAITHDGGVLRVIQYMPGGVRNVLFDEETYTNTGDGLDVLSGQRHRIMSINNNDYVQGMTERTRHASQNRLRRFRYGDRLNFDFNVTDGIVGSYQNGQLRLETPRGVVPENPGRRSRGVDIDRIFASPLLYGRQHEVMQSFYQNMITKLFWPDGLEQPISRVGYHHSRFTLSPGQQPGDIKAYGVEYNGRLYVLTHSGPGGTIVCGELSTEGGPYNINHQTGLIYPVPDNHAIGYNDQTAKMMFTNPNIMNRFMDHMVGQM